MRLHRRAALFCITLLSAAPAFAKPDLDELIVQLSRSDDFRLRVSAALELGRAMSPEALGPLSVALDDSNASVRAAAAAALETLGDLRAIAALKAHRADRSELVRRQIKASLTDLEAQAVTAPKPKLVIKLGTMKNGTPIRSQRMESDLAQASRRKLNELPGVKVLSDGEDTTVKKGAPPVVMVTGKIDELTAAREGASVVYTAKVEYVVHTMPEQSIAAKVSGSASASTSERDAKDLRKSAQIRKDVLEAAIASALRRAPPALIAAARL